MADRNNSQAAVLPDHDDEELSSRSAPDGVDSIVPNNPNPPKPARSIRQTGGAGGGKKWVRFDESAPDTNVENHHHQQQEESSSSSSAISAALPKPPVAPRRSQKSEEDPLNNGQHSSSIMNGETIMTTISEENAADDVARIDVSVIEEAKKKPISATTATEPSPIPTNTNTNARREQFENGKIITEKKPENKHCAWVTVAHFDPYKMPKSLISDQITMPVEDYVSAMETLTNDFRFRCYTVLYRRLIAGWLVASLFILMFILVSGIRGLTLFVVTLVWLFAAFGGVLVCLVIKKWINKGLHRCVASANKYLLRYNLLVGMEDRGKMSCHKICIPFVYMNPKDCLPVIEQLLARQQGQQQGVRSVNINVDDHHQGQYARAGPRTAKEQAEELILKYSQSYVKAFVRRSLRFPSRPGPDDVPLHCAHSYCLCQYLRKYHFDRAPRKWYHRFCLDNDLPGMENHPGFTSTVVPYGYPAVMVG